MSNVQSPTLKLSELDLGILGFSDFTFTDAY